VGLNYPLVDLGQTPTRLGSQQLDGPQQQALSLVTSRLTGLPEATISRLFAGSGSHPSVTTTESTAIAGKHFDPPDMSLENKLGGSGVNPSGRDRSNTCTSTPSPSSARKKLTSGAATLIPQHFSSKK